MKTKKEYAAEIILTFPATHKPNTAVEGIVDRIQRDAWEAGAMAQRDKITIEFSRKAKGRYTLSGSIQAVPFPEAPR